MKTEVEQRISAPLFSVVDLDVVVNAIEFTKPIAYVEAILRMTTYRFWCKLHMLTTSLLPYCLLLIAVCLDAINVIFTLKLLS